MIDFGIHHRHTNAVIYTANIDADEDTPRSLKLRLVVLEAVKEGVELRYADFRDADFRGVDFRGANFRGANFRGANFRGVDLQSANFRDADFRDADFRDADLQGADFRGADFRGVDLRDVYLQYANFLGADFGGVQVDLPVPIIENIHQTVYEAACKEGALDMDVWHTCDTTHCRAGWVVHLAGKAGKELEDRFGTEIAARLIYDKSDPNMDTAPDFYVTNEDALADMKLLADNEKVQND